MKIPSNIDSLDVSKYVEGPKVTYQFSLLLPVINFIASILLKIGCSSCAKPFLTSAKKICAQAVQQTEENSQFQFELAKSHLKKQKPAEALKALQAAEKDLGICSPEFWYLKAIVQNASTLNLNNDQKLEGILVACKLVPNDQRYNAVWNKCYAAAREHVRKSNSADCYMRMAKWAERNVNNGKSEIIGWKEEAAKLGNKEAIDDLAQADYELAEEYWSKSRKDEEEYDAYRLKGFAIEYLIKASSTGHAGAKHKLEELQTTAEGMIAIGRYNEMKGKEGDAILWYQKGYHQAKIEKKDHRFMLDIYALLGRLIEQHSDLVDYTIWVDEDGKTDSQSLYACGLRYKEKGSTSYAYDYDGVSKSYHPSGECANYWGWMGHGFIVAAAHKVHKEAIDCLERRKNWDG